MYLELGSIVTVTQLLTPFLVKPAFLLQCRHNDVVDLGVNGW